MGDRLYPIFQDNDRIPVVDGCSGISVFVQHLQSQRVFYIATALNRHLLQSLGEGAHQ